MDDNWSESIQDEIEALKSTFFDEIEVGNGDLICPFRIFVTLHPLTCQKSDKQYVCLTLDFKITREYPSNPPIVGLKSTRGLSDETISLLMRKASNIAEECRGSHSLYEIIEAVREGLTNSNIPTGQCVICLTGFSDADVFTKTECYHYYHSYCLAAYIENVMLEMKRQEEEEANVPHWQRKASSKAIHCPVCREEITYDLNFLKKAPEPVHTQMYATFTLTPEMEILQIKMEKLLQTQKSKGGIIGCESECEQSVFPDASLDSDVSNSSLAPNNVSTVKTKTQRGRSRSGRYFRGRFRASQSQSNSQHRNFYASNDSVLEQVANTSPDSFEPRGTENIPVSQSSINDKDLNTGHQRSRRSSRKPRRGRYFRRNSSVVLTESCNSVPGQLFQPDTAHGQDHRTPRQLSMHSTRGKPAFSSEMKWSETRSSNR